MQKRIIYTILIILIIGVGGWYLFTLNNKLDDTSDAKKFAEEYQTITDDNIFVYRSAEEIINILENGTGVIYLGFPECPWCKEYIVYLNDVAKESDIDKIYYFNILNDRRENTEEYLKIVDLLKDYLPYSDEGTKRIYVPAVIAVNNGNIVGFNDETSYDTKGYETPSEYWLNEDLEGFKERLRTMFNEVKVNYCTDCN